MESIVPRREQDFTEKEEPDFAEKEELVSAEEEELEMLDIAEDAEMPKEAEASEDEDGMEDLLPEDAGEEDIEKDMKEEDMPEAELKKRNARTVILQVEQNDSDEDTIDLVNIAGFMKRKWKRYAYLLVVAVCIAFAAAAVSIGAQGILGGKSSATAVVSFSFDGIDEGLNPNGGNFDVTKIKSTEVVNAALDELGWEGKDVEGIRANLKIEGVIPDSVKQQIAVINTVAEDAAEYYATVQDLDYFPSQYTVTLYRCKGMSGDETRELLDAILAAYRDYFMGAYANTSVLGMTTSVLDINAYDYLQASDMIANEIETIQEYVEAKAEEAPAFRASSTGLSFGDLSSAINSVKRLDLNNFVSFVQANNLTKDAGVQIDYYNYQIKQYNFGIQELQTQLTHVEKTIENYERNPVIVMSSQESVTETAQTDEYYNELLAQKLDLNKQISELNTDLNEAYAMINALNTAAVTASSEDYAYADALLEGLVSTVEGWSELVKLTTEEYFESELYAGAYRISIPAQYSTTGGGIGELAKRMVLFGGVAALVVVILWGIDGVKDEIVRGREKNRGNLDGHGEVMRKV